MREIEKNRPGGSDAKKEESPVRLQDRIKKDKKSAKESN